MSLRQIVEAHGADENPPPEVAEALDVARKVGDLLELRRSNDQRELALLRKRLGHISAL